MHSRGATTRDAAARLGILLVASCSRTVAPAARDAPVEPASASSTSSRADPHTAEGAAVPEAVAKLHANAFDRGDVEAELGRVLCVVTLHRAADARGDIYPLVVFAEGAVTTWTQTADGPREPFAAALEPEELATATALIDAIRSQRGDADVTFATEASVMGVSTRDGERIVTRYFDARMLPAELGRLVGLLKHRLEATNGPR
jgi:hypothetical protein